VDPQSGNRTDWNYDASSAPHLHPGIIYIKKRNKKRKEKRKRK